MHIECTLGVTTESWGSLGKQNRHSSCFANLANEGERQWAEKNINAFRPQEREVQKREHAKIVKDIVL